MKIALQWPGDLSRCFSFSVYKVLHAGKNSFWLFLFVWYVYVGEHIILKLLVRSDLTATPNWTGQLNNTVAE